MTIATRSNDRIAHDTGNQDQPMRARDYLPLSKQHFRQVIRRGHNDRLALDAVVGIAIPGPAEEAPIHPLGTYGLLVQYSVGGQPTQACVTARWDRDAAAVTYSNVRMVHDWSKNPHPGATGKMLDPRATTDPSVRKGEKPNQAWVSAGLLVDGYRETVCQNTAELPAVPDLPEILVAYSGRPAFPGYDAPELQELIARVQQMPGFASEEDRRAYVRMTYDTAVVEYTRPAGHAAGRTTVPSQCYLAPLAYAAAGLVDAMRTDNGDPVLFEDYTPLLGAEFANPAVLLAVSERNPVWPAARDCGVHLHRLLRDIHSENGPDLDNDPRIPKMIEAMRVVLGSRGEAFTEADYINAIVYPDMPIMAQFGQADVPLRQAARAILAETVPHAEPHISDLEIQAALDNPYGPLVVAGVVRNQVIVRNPELSIQEALSFTGDMLGRPELRAELAPAVDWRPAHRNPATR